MENDVHTLSSSDEDSNDSLPDIGVRPKPTNIITHKKNPETYTLSSDEDEQNSRLPNWPVKETEIEELDDVLCQPKNLSNLIEDSFHIERMEEERSEETENEKKRKRDKEGRRSEETEKEKKKREKEEKKRKRDEERERKKDEKAQEKASREAERLSKKAMKPGECMKYIVVEVDRRLVEAVAGSQIVAQLNQDAAGGVRYRIIDASIPSSVIFKRVHPLTLQESQAEEAIIVMEAEEFIEIVQKQMSEESENLCDKIRIWQTKLGACQISLVICGIEEYFKGQKKKKNNDMRSTILGKENGGRNKKIPSGNLNVSRIDIETSLVMGQLDCNLNHRLLSNPEKIASYILQVTKAVAETPFKQQRNESLFSWYAEGSSGGGVKVDKNGVGLLKLWHQQLRQFSLVGVEVAQAIAREYPSPTLLFKAYDNCPTERKASLLLADIPIRRGTGVLSSTRRVGPELSKKIYTLFNATDSTQIIGGKN